MPEHKNIAEALVAFQKEMPVVAKNKTANMGTYRYKYADLVDVSAAMHPLLTKHGLAFTCLPRQAPEGGGYELAGTLLHTSGEKLEGSLPLYGRTAQEIGSALTYARRYLAGCLTGICTDDDEDGQAATKAPRTTPEPVREWGVVADTAEMMSSVDDVKALWTQEEVSKAPKAIQERIKAHVASLKESDE